MLNKNFSVDAHSHPYLASHVIEDVPVLPVCLVLEWFFQMARQQTEVDIRQCKSFRLLHGVRLTDFYQRPQQFQVVSEDQKTTTEILALHLQSQQDERPNYQAQMILTKPTAAVMALPLPTADWQAWPCQLEEVYSTLLFHGPDFRAITALDRVSPAGGVVHLHGVQALGWPGEWLIDALAVDGVLQAVGLWAGWMQNKKSIPSLIREATFFQRQLPAGEMRCEFVCRVRGAHRVQADADLILANGQIYAQLRGIEMLCYGPRDE